MKDNRHDSQLKAMEHRLTQNEQILEYLLTGCSLTSREASRRLNIDRAGARVHELRKYHRWPIKSELIKTETGKVVAKYSL